MSKPVRILIAHFRGDVIGGAEIAVTDFIALGCPDYVYIMLVPEDGILANYYREKGFTVWVKKVQTRRRKYPGIHSVQSLFFSRQLKLKSIDLVISNDTPSASRVGTACRFARIPHVIYVRTLLSNKPENMKLLNNANGVFAVSRAVYEEVKKIVPKQHVEVLYDHLNIASIKLRINEHRLNGKNILHYHADNPVVGIVGRIQNIKQQDLFIKSIPLVLEKIKSARFVVIGCAQKSDDDYEKSLYSLVSQLGIEDKTDFLGFRAESLEIMSELTILCLTSSQEGFPRTILEAQALGCPVIAPNVGGCPEIVEDGVTGLLFPSLSSDSVKHLAEKIILLLKDQVLRDSLAENAQRATEKFFSGNQPVRKFEQSLKNIISNYLENRDKR